MEREGFDFYKTPFHIWLSWCLNKIHERGGHPVLWSEYKKEKDKCADDLLDKLQKYAEEQATNSNG